MARPRTGSLELRKGIWHARITVTRDGASEREWYSLDTPDRAAAERKLSRLQRELAAGRSSNAAAAVADAPDTVAAYAGSLGSRLSDGDHANLRVHVLPALGPLALVDVRPAHVKAVRDKAIAAKHRRGSSPFGRAKGWRSGERVSAPMEPEPDPVGRAAGGSSRTVGVRCGSTSRTGSPQP